MKKPWVVPFKVSVELLDGDGKEIVKLKIFDDGSEFSLMVEKTPAELEQFLKQLLSDYPGFSECCPNWASISVASEIEATMNQIVQFLEAKLWSYQPFTGFLDELFSRSSLVKHYLRSLEAELVESQNQCTSADHFKATVNDIACSMRNLLNELKVDPLIVTTQMNPISFKIETLCQYVEALVLQPSGFAPSGIKKSNPLEGDESQRHFPSGSALADRSLPKVDPYPSHPILPFSESRSPQSTITTTPSPTYFQAGLNPLPTSLPPFNTARPVNSIGIVSEEWSLLAVEEAMEVFMKDILPHEQQISYRMSALAVLKREIRAILGVLSYDIGLFPTRCFLPDDPIKLTLIVNPIQLTWWHVTMAEKMKNYAENTTEYHRLISEPGESISEELRIVAAHAIQNINCLQDKTAYKVTCTVDVLEAEITPNNRNELCLLAFLEEITTLVGHNQLFKRALLLIRSWWAYEAPVVAQEEVRQCLDEQTLSMMVVGIFNHFHHQITHPLMALLLFLREYSQFDPYSQVITIYGITSYESEASYQPKLLTSLPHHLISYEMMERYWKLFNINDSLNSEAPSGVPKSPLDINSRYEVLKMNMYRAIARFERKGFDVLHPFLNSNMMGEKLASQQLSLLQKAFMGSYQLMTENLKQVKEGELAAADILSKCFSATVAKMSSPHRPDTLNNAVTKTNNEGSGSANILSVYNALPRHLQSVYYCNFIADCIISDSAIITFCIDLLLIRGPLPAGEVGKILSEASSVQNLSHRLREKYGGLKKFLEKFPELFLFSNDHPFNPHILLRQTISQENIELMERGIFPMQLLSKGFRQGITYANLPRKPPTKGIENALPNPAMPFGNNNETASLASGRSNLNLPVSLPYVPSRSSSSLSGPYETTAMSSPTYGGGTSYETSSSRMSPQYNTMRTPTTATFAGRSAADSRYYGGPPPSMLQPPVSYSRSGVSEPVSHHSYNPASNMSSYRSQLPVQRPERDYSYEYQQRQRQMTGNMSSYANTTSHYEHHREYKQNSYSSMPPEGNMFKTSPVGTSSYGHRSTDPNYHQTISGISGGLFGSSASVHTTESHQDSSFGFDHHEFSVTGTTDESRVLPLSRNRPNSSNTNNNNPESMGISYSFQSNRDDSTTSLTSSQSNSRNNNINNINIIHPNQNQNPTTDRSYSSSSPNYFHRDPFSHY